MQIRYEQANWIVLHPMEDHTLIKRRSMEIFSIITCFVSYMTLLLGATVTQTDAGEGCGQTWPFCRGVIIPNFLSIDTIIEYSHRVVAGMDTAVICIIVVWSWWAYRKDYRIKLFGVLSVFFVFLQAVLGALTVVYEGTYAKDGLLSLHFGFSLLSLASVVLLALRIFQMGSVKASRQDPEVPRSRILQYAVWLVAAYTYYVVYSGALVQHSSSTLACGINFPSCGGAFLPSFYTNTGIQLLHRYSAGSIGLFILVLMIVIGLRFKSRRDLVWGSRWAFVFVCLQGVTGMAIVMTGGQLFVSLIHTTNIAILFSVLCYLCMQVEWPFMRRRMKAPANNQIETITTEHITA
jgi:cytochrome c oxidase assembly protein subunit 15